MTNFKDRLIVTPVGDGKHWELLEEFRYILEPYPEGSIIIVPEGFITDFTSVPWFFRSLISVWGRYGKAAIIHDYAYHEGLISRKWSDDVFKEAMGVLGVAWWRKSLLYAFVRLFGGLAWQSHAKRRKERDEQRQRQ